MQEEISFGTWLRKQRRAIDLSQKALANQVGCAEVTLRRIEEGTLKPSKELANILLEKLGVSESERPQWIFFARGLAGIPLLSSLASTKSFDGYCPYKGLDVFEEEDAELFFGREGLVQELVGRVKESRTLFIIGPSGSGKSSLVRAGLIYALKQGAIKSLHSERWLYETMKPGRDPIGELARITSSMAGTTKAGDELRDRAFADHGILEQWCEIALKEGGNKRVILFIDQFEEIFSEVSNEEERLTFINLVTQAATAENGRVIVLFAMRSDFVMSCATYPKLNALFNQQSIQIGAMEPAELANAIARPALNVDLRIDRDLIEEIIEDMRGEPGALPLMQFALKDLFDSQQARGGGMDLTLNDYRQHGGLHRSLERHADRAFAKLQANEQELARSIFSGLIEIGRGTQDTRRTALLDELIPSTSTGEEVKAVVRKLADARLITTDEVEGKDTITISHEKLMDAWPWLKKLVDENRDAIALQNEIANDVKEWEEHGRDTSYLYTGVRLFNSYERLNANKFIVSSTAYDFLQRGFLRQQHAQRTRFLGISGVIGLIVAGIILFAYISAMNSSKLAEQSQNYASTQIVLASTSQAIANTAQANFEEAQKQANIALAGKLAAQAQSLFAAGNSRQMTAVLMAVRSMQLYPSIDAANILQNNTLARHIVFSLRDDSFITSVAFSPDGKYVVSGSDDGTARVLETSTGQEVARMHHDDAVNSLAFSPDGKYVVSGSNDKTARVWEATTGQEVARMTHGGLITSVAFSPDGKYVLSVTRFVIRVWDVKTSREVARITHGSYITSVAFSPDGKYVVSGSDDYTARVWEAASGQKVARMLHDFHVTSVAFSPDGKYVVSGSDDKTARVWEATTGKETARMKHSDGVYRVAFSPDGKYVISVSGPNSVNDPVGTIDIWEVKTSQEVAHMTHDGVINSVAFSPDGKHVVSGSGDGTVRVWDAISGQEVARMTYESPVSLVAFNQDGDYIQSIYGKDIIHRWVWQPDRLIANACAYITRNLTFSEWQRYIGDGLPYQAICPNLPIESYP